MSTTDSEATVDLDYIQTRIEKMDDDLRKTVRNAQMYQEFTVELAKQGVISPWEIQVPGWNGYINLNVYDDYNDEGEYVHTFSAEKSKAKIASFFNAARKLVGNKAVTKDYRDDEFRVTVELSEDFKVHATVKRDAVCVKKVVGRTWVDPYVSKGHWEDEVEWDCETPSLIADK